MFRLAESSAVANTVPGAEPDGLQRSKSQNQVLYAERDHILHAVGYETMPMFEVRSVCRANEDSPWVALTKENEREAIQYCRVAKNAAGPRFEFSYGSRVGTGSEASFATTGISAHTGLIEAQAGIRFSEGRAGAVEFRTGFGVTTGAGIKDDSLHLKVAGCGLNLGRKVGISILDNEIAFDLGKFLGGNAPATISGPETCTHRRHKRRSSRIASRGTDEQDVSGEQTRAAQEEAAREEAAKPRKPSLDRLFTSSWKDIFSKRNTPGVVEEPSSEIEMASPPASPNEGARTWSISQSLTPRRRGTIHV